MARKNKKDMLALCHPNIASAGYAMLIKRASELILGQDIDEDRFSW